MKSVNYLLLTILLGGSGLLQAQDDLELDRTFFASSLPSSGPGFLVRDFTIVNGSIFYLERSLPKAPKEHYVRELAITPHGDHSRTSSLAITGCELYSLGKSGSEIIFFDFVQKEIASYDTATDKLRFLGSSPGYHSIHQFHNGNMIATVDTTGILYEHGAIGPEAIENLQGFMAEHQLRAELAKRHARAMELGVYDTFLLNPDLSVGEPLLLAFDHEKLGGDAPDQRDPLQRALSQRTVRISPDGKVAAVFSNHRPGIKLFNESGILVADIPSPGEGRVIPPGEPYEGEHVSFQADVLVNKDHILVVDNSGNKIWVISLEGQEIAAFKAPFVVSEAEGDGDHLYLRGVNGEFFRYRYPYGAAEGDASTDKTGENLSY